MRKPQGGLLVTAAIAVIFSLGCEDKQAGAPAAAGEVPLERWVEKAGDEIMASDKKAEAGWWLKDDNHVLFKLDGGKKKLVGLVEEFYAAGAEKVYIADVESEAGKDIARTVLVVLPKDAAARAKLFEIDKRALADPVTDKGQKYLYYSFD